MSARQQGCGMGCVIACNNEPARVRPNQRPELATLRVFDSVVVMVVAEAFLSVLGPMVIGSSD